MSIIPSSMEVLEVAKLTGFEEIFAVEHACGLDPEDAWVVAAVPDPPEDPQEPPQRRSRIARQTIRTIDERIEFLKVLENHASGDECARHARAVAELAWCRGVVANGGTVPEEWFSNLEEDGTKLGQVNGKWR